MSILAGTLRTTEASFAGQVLLVVLLVAACTLAVSRPGMAKTLIDQADRRVTVPDHAQRVVSLAPNITEIIYELHRQKRLVGVTRFSTYPAAAKALPRIGTYVRLDLEKIVSLKPDLCIAIRDGNPRQVVKRLTAMDVPVYVVDPRNLKQIMATMLEIGVLMDAEPRAASLVAAMQQRISRVKARIDATVDRPTVFFQLDFGPIISAGSNTFIDELILLAGGRNLAGAAAAYPRFTWEDILLLAPEVVVVTRMAGGLGPDELLAQWQQWRQVPAVRAGRVHVVDADLFNRATSRLVAGLEELADIIHPETMTP